VGEGLPSVELVLTSCNKELVLEALKLGGRVADSLIAICRVGAYEEGAKIFSLSLVLNKNFLPRNKKFLGSGLCNSSLNVLIFHINPGKTGALSKVDCKLIKLSLFYNVASHLDQVIGGVAFDTSSSLYQSLVLLRIWLVEESLTSKPRLLGLDDTDLVLDNDF